MKNKESLKSILDKFKFEGECCCHECHNVGNINDTTIITYSLNGEYRKYILQKINHTIFTNPEALMDNMIKVTLHIQDKVKTLGGDLDINLYNNFVKGVMESCADILTEAEIENIPFSAKLITIELAMRFLTDYINGDKYFKTNYENHNLDRARNQLKLAYDMEQKLN